MSRRAEVHSGSTTRDHLSKSRSVRHRCEEFNNRRGVQGRRFKDLQSCPKMILFVDGRVEDDGLTDLPIGLHDAP
jgi:hypothetical protein